MTNTPVKSGGLIVDLAAFRLNRLSDEELANSLLRHGGSQCDEALRVNLELIGAGQSSLLGESSPREVLGSALVQMNLPTLTQFDAEVTLIEDTCRRIVQEEMSTIDGARALSRASTYLGYAEGSTPDKFQRVEKLLEAIRAMEDVFEMPSASPEERARETNKFEATVRDFIKSRSAS